MKVITDEELIKKAKSVILPQKNASGKLIADVGAALVTDKGEVYLGVCIDTIEGSGICAERSAIAAMVTAGEYKENSCSMERWIHYTSLWYLQRIYVANR